MRSRTVFRGFNLGGYGLFELIANVHYRTDPADGGNRRVVDPNRALRDADGWTCFDGGFALAAPPTR